MIAATDRLTPAERLSSISLAAEHDGTAHALLEQSGLLGWNVRTLDVAAAEITDSGVTSLALPRSAATVSTLPDGSTQAIGVVGAGYTPIQNEEMVPFLDALSEASGGRFSAAGCAPDRSSVFEQIKTPTSVLIGGDDEVGVSMLVANSHDGRGAFTVRSELVRLVCTNGLTAAIPGTRHFLAIRHTSGAADALDVARSSLDVVTSYAARFRQAAEPMLTQAVVDTRFAEIVGTLLPSTAERNPHIDAVLALRLTSSTLPDDARGTAWGGYQALTEYVDHLIPTRGNSSTARARRAMGSTISRMKSRAFAELRR